MRVLVGVISRTAETWDVQAQFRSILETSVVVCSGRVPRRSQPWKNHHPPTKRALQYQQACGSSPCSLQGCRASYSGSREESSRFICWRQVWEALLSIARDGITSTPLRRDMGPDKP